MSNMQAGLFPHFDILQPFTTERLDTVLLSFRVSADRRRILSALTLPEYMEAWLQPPAADESLFFNFVTPERFQIDLFRAEARSGSIHGSIRMLEAGRIRYMWKWISSAGVSDTAVDLKLSDDASPCAVNVAHSGFRSAACRAWHSQMWQESITRLCTLLRAH